MNDMCVDLKALYCMIHSDATYSYTANHLVYHMCQDFVMTIELITLYQLFNHDVKV